MALMSTMFLQYRNTQSYAVVVQRNSAMSDQAVDTHAQHWLTTGVGGYLEGGK